MNEESQINYYAIIPATVRYDQRLKASEKLLYGEITALANKYGYCYAQNKYFAELYNVTIGNCDVRISMGTTDVLTAKYFCDATGISTVETTSLRKSASLEGTIEEYGQHNISTQKRNLLNIDEILRIPSTQLLVLLRGNKPLLLDKLIYKEHNISKKLDDTSIQEYIPNWNKNTSIETKVLKNYIENKEKDNSQNSFDNF